jgi:hypothetical protein
MAARFWSDTFDMDLPRILPQLDDVLGDATDIPLWTHGHTSHGRLNHPAVWGMAACFGTSPDSTRWKPDTWYTSHPVVECTWREALRDAWPHTYVILIDQHHMWDGFAWRRTFERLMYDLRGQVPLPGDEADRLRRQVLASVIAATRLLTEHVEAVADAR